jgi:hypothetical protein
MIQFYIAIQGNPVHFSSKVLQLSMLDGWLLGTFISLDQVFLNCLFTKTLVATLSQTLHFLIKGPSFLQSHNMQYQSNQYKAGLAVL